ncbi:tRNA guanosine(34) transglycosylase Tgt, partial [Patescibacteria group bacterium]|nr:tRNA guanosine(34) transglycosylase Tgt [Patescibacteria group bacterium]
MAVSFEVVARDPATRARAGVLHTPHGSIETPAFVGVATLATLKGLPLELLAETPLSVLIANTYHLYLRPGEELVARAGGLHAFMGWEGPLMTDSGGFQVFSLGAAFGKTLTKVAREDIESVEQSRNPAVWDPDVLTQHGKLAVIDEEGVTFTSHLDGSLHRFTPERSIEIQHQLGADILFAFDECTAATADWAYQKEAMERTHRWAERSLKAHRRNVEANQKQGLFPVVQGGRFEDLRRESARTLAAMDVPGFGIGGSYVKEDLEKAVDWVVEELPEEKPRHLLGIGEPEDLLSGIDKGVDLFDCVQPTRLGRT